MNKINDGGAAFPQPCTNDGYAANSYYAHAGGGMSLRDYFAGQALIGLQSNEINLKNENVFPEKLAEWAYAQADAMLKARDEKQSI